MSRASGAVLLLALATGGTPPLPAPAASGTARMIFEITHPTAVPDLPDHQVHGWSQRVVHREERLARVEIVADVRPLGIRAAFPVGFLPETAGPYLVVGEEESLRYVTKDLLVDADDTYAASSRLLALTARRVRNREDHSADLIQDAVNVWREGKATCVGHANLAVALHRLAGIPARTAHGLRLDAPRGTSAQISPVLLHRWVEVFHSDLGWVPSDTARSLHFIGPEYILLSLGHEEPRRVEQRLKGLRIRVLHRSGGIRETDVADPNLGLPRATPPLAPNEGKRIAGALQIRTRPGDRLMIEGNGLQRAARADAQGLAVFVGLEGGLYEVRSQRGSRIVVLIASREIVEAKLP